MESNQRKTIVLGVTAGVLVIIAAYLFFGRKAAVPEISTEDQKAAEAARAAVQDTPPPEPQEPVPSRRAGVHK